ncbi:MAG: hypothetical protein HYT16_03330 [DPANN group archaeon]|nr:hypothetical protein [DPANN group archaeon]
MIVKLFGIVDLVAAAVVAFHGFPILDALKWIFVVILIYKGVMSLIG